MFKALLILTCDILEKSLDRSGYEAIEYWSIHLPSVPCRHETKHSVKINDSNIRINTDDDLFFFASDVDIKRGQRILLNDLSYDVVKVDKVLDSKEVHHIEVIGRLVDNN